MNDKTRISESGARCLRVMKKLRGHSLQGLSNNDLVQALGMNASAINRCLGTLISEGLAVKLDNGRFALSVAALQIAQAHAEEMTRASSRINELNQRVAAGSQH